MSVLILTIFNLLKKVKMNIKYDFDKITPRENTGCLKWDIAERLFGDKDIIPMWVADMDFPIAKEITEAIKERSDHEIYGYAMPGQEATDAVINRMKGKYQWDVRPEWIVFTPGIVPALFASVKAFTHPGDEVVIQEPVYAPIRYAVKENGCHIINNELQLKNGHYEIDFDELGRSYAFTRSQMMIFCSPHNPVGRAWTRKELSRIGKIIIENNGVIISDEIHGEIIYGKEEHIPLASMSPELEQCSLTCISPSKTFNIAGLGASAIIIPNDELRRKFNRATKGIMPMLNCFGITSLVAAYNHGDEWLKQFLEYLQENLDFLTDFFETRIGRIKVIKPEATYLVWLDCREFGLDKMALRDFIRKEAKLGLEDGFIFGTGGEGFQRINIACPRSLLSEALIRLENAVNGLLLREERGK